ncbi:MAG: acetyl-CoA carboxylase biotin carboxyl carrier protein subunit [Candidatus Pelagibacter sp. TMED64]|nr:acetyl-CoA carboxylase biotin carboxyl carrier protein subunit [Candidatus Pelagibacter sp.]OUU67595.1 MAG: acetyl-CoA carboxylase biotin carboxyl carrier protein subunit [Candidatus Pelagibacter sp. TMED64]|tara:strand:+ start:10106 stop:10510 length:405 start_codon:yes stop_codon:yes gene_type:complete
MKIDKKIIKELVDCLNEFGLTELEYGNETLKVKVSKNTNISSASNIIKTESKNKIENASSINSPIVGTAYLASEPGAKPFVEKGSKIKKGQTIMIVEAMKTMNHVPSTKDGVIKEILVKDGQPVEFGQALVLLD